MKRRDVEDKPARKKEAQRTLTAQAKPRSRVGAGSKPARRAR